MDQKGKYIRITAKDNNDYICPLQIAQSGVPLGDDQLDDCVEADVAGRYIGHLNIVGNV